jgi:hypothetical protein
MTLFIACILIYKNDMDWKFYILAVLLWSIKLGILAGWRWLFDKQISDAESRLTGRLQVIHNLIERRA